MANPHYTMRHSLDPHPVRPGTSDALFARTIDATVHPPLVRAQETVAALIPRVAVPLGSPLLLSMLGITLVMLWAARRMKFRPSALILSGLLVMTLTSFHPQPASTGPQVSDDTVSEVRRVDSWTSPDRYQMPEPVALPDVPDMADATTPIAVEPPDYVDESPATPADDPTPSSDRVVEMPGFDIPLPGSDQTESIRIPPVSVHIDSGFEVSARDREELRRAIEQLQRRVRAEMRRQVRQRIY
jgi:hypothetical protein